MTPQERCKLFLDAALDDLRIADNLSAQGNEAEAFVFVEAAKLFRAAARKAKPINPEITR